MTNAELIATIRNEIERLENYYTSVERHIEALISFLSALESEKQKEVKPCHRTREKLAEWSKTQEGRESYEKVAEEMRKQIVPNDLEEAAKKYATEYHENPDGSAWKPYFEESAIKAFIAGADWQKEQMMKEAVEGTVHNFSSYKPHPTVLVDTNGFNQGDKVRVIICKKED